MRMSLDTSLSSMAWGRKFLSACVAALLLFSMLLVAAPLAPVTHAEAVRATATVDKIAVTAGKIYGEQTDAFGLIFTITNPSTNNVPIKQVNIVIPPEWTAPNDTNVKLAPTNIGEYKISGANVIVVELASPYLQPGASFNVIYGLDSPNTGIRVPSKVASGVADVYTFEVYTMDIVSNVLVPVSEHPKVYVTSATAIQTVEPSSDVSVSADDKTYTVSFTINAAESGVPLRVSLSSYSAGYKGNLSQSIIWTDSSGRASVVLNLDTTAGAYTNVTASAWITATNSPTAPASLESGSIITVAGAATKLTITSPTTTTYVRNGATQSITIAVTDQFGNPKPVAAPLTVSLTIIEAVGGRVGTIPPTATILAGSSSVTVYYDLATTYGTVGSYCRIYASAPGLAGATSPKLITRAASDTTVSIADDLSTSIPAGGSDQFVVTVSPAQAGINVTFTVTWTVATGTISAPWVLTGLDGKAAVTLTVPTKAGATAQITAKAYDTDGTQIGTTLTSASATVVAGPATKLVVKTYEDITLTKEKTAVKPGGTLYVDVLLTDAYGNLVTTATVLQVNLASTAGSLSQTTAYIAAGEGKLSTSGYKPVFTAPTTITTVTITASTPLAGISAGSAVVSVIAPQPRVTITDPPADTTVVSEVAVTKWIAGYVTVSPAQPVGTTITDIKYSLNAAANVSVPIIYIAEGKYYFNFSVTLAPDRINTITVYAIDSEGSVGSETRKITVTPVPTQPVFPAEIKTPTLVDTAGRPVETPRVGTIVAISSPIVNKLDRPQQTLYIVQVKDATGAIVSFNFVTGTIPANTELTFAVSWRPTEPGTYTIEVFAWNNFIEAEVLAPMQTITINVT